MKKDASMQDLFKKAVKKFNTPLYLYSEKIIVSKINDVLKTFKGIDFHPTFALKANSNPNLLKIMREKGFGSDVVSPGELRASVMAGIDPKNIVWNGCGKSLAEMIEFLAAGIGKVNIDSIEELANWKEALKTSKHRPEFFVRINSEVDAMTHPFIATGLKKHKFGIPVKLLEKLFEMAKKNGIKIAGFHSHIGSQVTDVTPYFDAFSQITVMAREHGIKKINIGGGWGIDYTGDKLDLAEYRKKVIPLFKDFEITSEFGRFIVAEAGFYIITVQVTKFNGYKYFVVADGGMNHLLRPALYSAIHDFEVIGKVNDKFEASYNIVGPLCESGDVLYTNRDGELPEPGSLIVFKNAGAYGYAMASNYNSTVRPAEALIAASGELKLIRRRETLEDLFQGVIM